MKKYFKLLLCACLFGFVASSCSNDEETIDPSKYMPISGVVAGPESLSARYGGDTLSINVEARSAWTVSVDKDWVTAEKLSGEGSAILKVYVAPNAGTADRTATVQVTAGDKSSTITINQVAEFYTTSEVRASFAFTLPTAVAVSLNCSENLESVKFCAVPKSVADSMSVSEKLAYVQSYGSQYVLPEKKTGISASYSGLTENTEYSLLFVGIDEDKKVTAPFEFSFNTPEPNKEYVTTGWSVGIDESNWYVSAAPESTPGCYILRISDTSDNYAKYNGGNTSTLDMARIIYNLTNGIAAPEGTSYEGMECRYAESEEVLAFARTRKDLTRNDDASLFIVWCSSRDFKQTSSMYMYHDAKAEAFVNQ